MEKLKVGDKARVVVKRYTLTKGLLIGDVVTVYEVYHDFVTAQRDGDTFPYFFDCKDLQLTSSSTESQSKKIKQALKKICLSGMVIKSEDIIAKVKQEAKIDFIFGDTILRGLRQLRQDGVIDYTADKQTREYTFK